MNERAELSELPSYATVLLGDDSAKQLQGATKIRVLLSAPSNPPIQLVCEQQGVLERLVALMADEGGDERLRFECAWALTNVASGTSEQTRLLLHSGALPVFIRCLGAANQDLNEQAVWGIGNISGDGPRVRDRCLAEGALGPMVEMLQRPELKLSGRRNATWALSNLCRGPTGDRVALAAASPALPLLAGLVAAPGQDHEVLCDACWALSYLAEGSNDGAAAVVACGAVPDFVRLLEPEYPATVLDPALRAVGNVAAGAEPETQVRATASLTFTQ